MILIKGNDIAKQIRTEIAEEVKAMLAQGKRAPHLAAILVGMDGASQTYVANKVKDCEEVGFESSLFHFDENTSEEEVLNKIKEINNNPLIDGLIVQLPLPKQISSIKVTETIAAEKDVDGFHPLNVGRMNKGLPSYIAATPYGVIQLLERYNIPTKGKHCVVIGRSDIVGTPASILMSRNSIAGNATVTLCHSHTENLKKFTLDADIIIAAIGKPGFLTGDMIKPGAVLIDVGITRVSNPSKKSGFELKGDINQESVEEKAGYLTPVPGGVGPMTRIGLLQNTLKAAQGIIFPKN